MGTRGPVPLQEGESTSRHADQQFTPLESTGVKPPPARGWAEWSVGAREFWRCVKAEPVARSWNSVAWQLAMDVAKKISDRDGARPGSRMHRVLQREIDRLLEQLMLTPLSQRRMRHPESPLVDPPDTGSPAGDEVPDYRRLIAEA